MVRIASPEFAPPPSGLRPPPTKSAQKTFDRHQWVLRQVLAGRDRRSLAAELNVTRPRIYQMEYEARRNLEALGLPAELDVLNELADGA